jgi:hypothetical protein
LITEPWIFVVDGQGIVRAKFEGLVTERELEAALQQALKIARSAAVTASSMIGLNDHDANTSKS